MISQWLQTFFFFFLFCFLWLITPKAAMQFSKYCTSRGFLSDWTTMPLSFSSLPRAQNSHSIKRRTYKILRLCSFSADQTSVFTRLMTNPDFCSVQLGLCSLYSQWCTVVYRVTVYLSCDFFSRDGLGRFVMQVNLSIVEFQVPDVRRYPVQLPRG